MHLEEGYRSTSGLFEGDVVVQQLRALRDTDRCSHIARVIGAECSTSIEISFVVDTGVKRASVTKVNGNYPVVLHFDVQPVAGSGVCAGIHVLNDGAVPPVVNGISVEGNARSRRSNGMKVARCE